MAQFFAARSGSGDSPPRRQQHPTKQPSALAQHSHYTPSQYPLHSPLRSTYSSGHGHHTSSGPPIRPARPASPTGTFRSTDSGQSSSYSSLFAGGVDRMRGTLSEREIWENEEQERERQRRLWPQAHHPTLKGKGSKFSLRSLATVIGGGSSHRNHGRGSDDGESIRSSSHLPSPPSTPKPPVSPLVMPDKSMRIGVEENGKGGVTGKAAKLLGEEIVPSGKAGRLLGVMGIDVQAMERARTREYVDEFGSIKSSPSPLPPRTSSMSTRIQHTRAPPPPPISVPATPPRPRPSQPPPLPPPAHQAGSASNEPRTLDLGMIGQEERSRRSNISVASSSFQDFHRQRDSSVYGLPSAFLPYQPSTNDARLSPTSIRFPSMAYSTSSRATSTRSSLSTPPPTAPPRRQSITSRPNVKRSNTVVSSASSGTRRYQRTTALDALEGRPRKEISRPLPSMTAALSKEEKLSFRESRPFIDWEWSDDEDDSTRPNDRPKTPPPPSQPSVVTAPTTSPSDPPFKPGHPYSNSFDSTRSRPTGLVRANTDPDVLSIRSSGGMSFLDDDSEDEDDGQLDLTVEFPQPPTV